MGGWGLAGLIRESFEEEGEERRDGWAYTGVIGLEGDLPIAESGGGSGVLSHFRPTPPTPGISLPAYTKRSALARSLKVTSCACSLGIEESVVMASTSMPLFCLFISWVYSHSACMGCLQEGSV